MRCHYEVLGVSQTATEDDLKKAYKKLALQWHPDKNPDRIAEAKQRFLEVRAAYEVLTDPRERAWYDSHRDVILKKGSGDDYEDDAINIYPFFTSSCYQGYNDSDTGFYTIYNKLFKDIAEQDLKGSNDKDFQIPEFGNSQSDYDEIVGPFYAYWSNYMTLRSYVWVEEHDVREAQDRRVRRLMEQENKKLRDKAKKERNEEIRELVAFVKKRDKRLQLRKLFLEEQAAQKKKADVERRNREKQKKLEELARYKESQWLSFDEFEKQFEDIEKNLKDQFNEPNDNEENSAEDSDEEDDELYCVACNKSFKSDKAFLNHENSRKHKELVQLIKEQMKQENDELQLVDATAEEDLGFVPLPINDQTSKSKKKKKKQRRNNKENESADEEIVEVEVQSEEVTSKKKNNDKTNDETNEQTPIILQCFVCQEEFSSRNALFKHIKEMDHAKPVTVTVTKTKTKTKRK